MSVLTDEQRAEVLTYFEKITKLEPTQNSTQICVCCGTFGGTEWNKRPGYPESGRIIYSMWNTDTLPDPVQNREVFVIPDAEFNVQFEWMNQ